MKRGGGVFWYRYLVWCDLSLLKFFERVVIVGRTMRGRLFRAAPPKPPWNRPEKAGLILWQSMAARDPRTHQTVHALRVILERAPIAAPRLTPGCCCFWAPPPPFRRGYPALRCICQRFAQSGCRCDPWCKRVTSPPLAFPLRSSARISCAYPAHRSTMLHC